MPSEIREVSRMKYPWSDPSALEFSFYAGVREPQTQPVMQGLLYSCATATVETCKLSMTGPPPCS